MMPAAILPAAILEVRGLGKRFGGFVALENINITVAAGERPLNRASTADGIHPSAIPSATTPKTIPTSVILSGAKCRYNSRNPHAAPRPNPPSTAASNPAASAFAGTRPECL